MLLKGSIPAVLLLVLFEGRPSSAQEPSVTFNRDISPLVAGSCAGCHRPGGGAPFSLLTYEEVRRRAALVAEVTGNGYMPPWKPEAGYGTFAGERRLTAAERALFRRWVDSGAPEGDPVDRPAASLHQDGWQLGTPDLVVSMPEPYGLEPGGTDVFRTFVMPIALDAGRYVKGVEFRPGVASSVHHAVIKVDRTRSSRLLDEEEAGAGYDGGAGRNASFPDGHFLGWTPGQVPAMLPDGMGWRLEPDTDLVLELHLMPSGRPEQVQSSVGIFFADEPPSRPSRIVRLGSQSIDIPAGKKGYAVTDTFVLPVDLDVVSVQPHAHYLAREIKGFARLPDGTTKWLLYIKDWDFRWQDVYRFAEPLELPKGTTLAMHYTYDNSAGNIRNPHRPPRRVTFGQTTSSEMGNLWIQVTARPEALATLDGALAPKLLQGDIAGTEKMLEANPGDARLRAELAMLYLAASRPADAVAQLERAVRLAPRSAPPRHALGTALLRQGRLEAARRQLDAAVRLEPDFPEAFNNLGIVSQAQGKFDEAAALYAEALRIQPGNVEARYNLGRLHALRGDAGAAAAEFRRALQVRPDDADTLSSLGSALALLGEVDEAILRFRRALELRPDLPSALTDLAWILATSDRLDIRAPDDAVLLAERAAGLTGRRNAAVLDTLAAAYASAGRHADALRTARLALEAASNAGADELAAALRERLKVYAERAR